MTAKNNKLLCVPPAMQAGILKNPMTIEDIANLITVEAPKKTWFI
jgi:hypothetical protein